MIVKVQLSLTTYESHQMVLIYNEDRSILWQGPASEEIKTAMGKELKRFFSARLVDTKIRLGREVQQQNW